MKVYVALLEKIAKLESNCFEGEAPVGDKEVSWITLGHFDRMRVYELPMKKGNTLFEVIRENNGKITEMQSGERYFHPLYLISPEEKERKPWDRGGDAPFLAVARIHFSRSVDAGRTYQDMIEELERRKEKEELGCQYRAFRTIELSDMILALWENKLSSVLDAALTLRSLPGVGKVYTYVGIRYEKVKDMNWTPEAEDKIGLFSMRFSVKDFEKAEEAAKHIKGILDPEEGAEGREKPGYSVAGVDDMVINWRELETERLIALYQDWFMKDGAEKLQCFAGVTTRVGIPMDRMRETKSEAPDERLQKKCAKLRELCGTVQERWEGEDWTAPLSTLVHTLARISETSVLDEFVYIMYEGVEAFLKNMAEGPGRVKISAEWCQDFVENLGHLMEHVLRAEGQLTHNPELRPVLYHIPVAMLEYTLAFLREAAEILQGKDKEKAKIRFLLAPRLCERTRARELFPAWPEENLPGLVLVTLPLEKLYDAEAIQRELCHEVSHFVGEVCRNREKRRELYSGGAAALLARRLFYNDHPALVDTIWEELDRILPTQPEGQIMKDMTEGILGWIESIYEDESKYFTLIERAMRKSIEMAEVYPYSLELRGEDTVLSQGKIKQCRNLLRDLGSLFREVYADVCMLYLLPELDLKEYVESNVRDLETEAGKGIRRYDQIAIRLYVALKATENEGEIPLAWIKNRDPELGKKMEAVGYFVERETEKMDQLFPTTSVMDLLAYAEKCYQKQKKGSQELKELRELRRMYRNMTPRNQEKMNYRAFLEYIDKYREKILKEEE